MYKILCSIIALSFSLSSFANYNVSCSNAKGDTIVAKIAVTGEPQTNGTWDYVSALAEVDFNIEGTTGTIRRNTVVVLERFGWDVEAYNLYHGYSELVKISKNGKKITARYVDGKLNVRLPCKSL